MWLISNKTTVADSGLLEGLHDCHSHLLPAVDDGVETADEALAILDIWQSAGVSEVWLTPHIMEDIPNKTDALRERFTKLQAAYTGNITLRLAAEHMMDNLFRERLAADDVMSIDGDSRMLLVETSYYNAPMDMERTIDSIKDHGYTPLLAHPERYRYMGMADYRKWKERGVMMQLNLPSLVGAYGAEVHHKAKALLDQDMYDCLGTDTHSRRFAEYFVGSKIGKSTIRKIERLKY